MNNSSTLPCDMLGLFVDAKPIDVKDGKVLKNMTIYTVIGFLMSGHKKLILCLNRTFEKIRLNNGGYFQSNSDLEFKFQLSIDYLHNGSWKNPGGNSMANLNEMLRIFTQHFEQLEGSTL